VDNGVTADHGAEGVTVAAIGAIFWFLVFPLFPLFAFTILAVLVIYGVSAHWDEIWAHSPPARPDSIRCAAVGSAQQNQASDGLGRESGPDVTTSTSLLGSPVDR
jgi:hypothetical protein